MAKRKFRNGIFLDGIVFLPEETVVRLCLPHREIRRRFTQEHARLPKVDYWNQFRLN